MENSRKTNSNGVTHAEALYSPNGSTTAAPSLQSIYNPPRPRGEVGWICPVCGRGNAPSITYCNCYMTKLDIVYANDGLTDRSVLDNAIPCHTKMNEYATTATTSNSPHVGTTTANASK